MGRRDFFVAVPLIATCSPQYCQFSVQFVLSSSIIQLVFLFLFLSLVVFPLHYIAIFFKTLTKYNSNLQGFPLSRCHFYDIPQNLLEIFERFLENWALSLPVSFCTI